MSSYEYIREFVNERLAAAAEEIFGVFIKTINEHEKDINRQRIGTDFIWKPEIRLHRIELPLQQKEEILTDQQCANKESNSSVDQEEPAFLRVKEEEEELATTAAGEQLALKQETDAFVLTPTYEESNQPEPELNGDQLIIYSSHVVDSQEQIGDSVSSKDEEPKLKEQHCKSDHQLPSGSSRVTEKQNQKSGKHGHSRSSTNAVAPTMSKIDCNTNTEKKSFNCDFCGRVFNNKSQFEVHRRSHTGEKPYICETCGKRYQSTSALNAHVKTHNVEKPCFRFSQRSILKHDLKVHTREKPYSCKEYGRSFSFHAALEHHMKTHTELPLQQKEEILTDQQCANKESNSSVDQEEPAFRRVKEEEEELATTAAGEQLALKRETDAFVLTPTYEESNQPELNGDQLIIYSSHVVDSQEQIGDSVSSKDEEPKLKEQHCKSDHQLPSGSSRVTEKLNQKRSKHGHSRSSTNAVAPSMSKIDCNTNTEKKSFNCDFCGRVFNNKSQFEVHRRSHTGEKPYICKTCGKRYQSTSALNAHVKTHNVEKPCFRFSQRSILKHDLKVHTREKPYSCKEYGRSFSFHAALEHHMKTHTVRSHTFGKPV